MKVVLQRVSSAEVQIDGSVVGEIKTGVLLLLGVAPDDDRAKADWLVEKILALRIFPNPEDTISPTAISPTTISPTTISPTTMQRGLEECNGEALVVSQFTLFADVAKGRRPSFSGAAEPILANELYQYFVAKLAARVHVQTGRFGADMQVSSTNEGPMTLILER
ncbi:MAG: D-aminoacyl-tRNA deacylase [Pseudomonadales bacterium]|jgi:D-tyrosyl-tRNA(Tyr) deacylase|tara:strand:+ start:1249 stop:1743 length:495 start_codon:yes stop_codon:yes gene_type:complete